MAKTQPAREQIILTHNNPRAIVARTAQIGDSSKSIPAGIEEISRRLSAATPPDEKITNPSSRPRQGSNLDFMNVARVESWSTMIGQNQIVEPEGSGMSSTYLSLQYHFVFSTKHRIESIDAEWRDSLHSYLAGILTNLGAAPQRIGGVADHVHVLVGLLATHRVADVLRELKKGSSIWVHKEIGLASFGWQEGYSGFTLSPNTCAAVNAYIANQEEHHRKKSFHEELIEMLDRAGVEYDPRYLD